MFSSAQLPSAHKNTLSSSLRLISSAQKRTSSFAVKGFLSNSLLNVVGDGILRSSTTGFPQRHWRAFAEELPLVRRVLARPGFGEKNRSVPIHFCVVNSFGKATTQGFVELNRSFQPMIFESFIALSLSLSLHSSFIQFPVSFARLARCRKCAVPSLQSCRTVVLASVQSSVYFGCIPNTQTLSG